VLHERDSRRPGTPCTGRIVNTAARQPGFNLVTKCAATLLAIVTLVLLIVLLT
jgi:hypothetical protein